MMRGHATKNSTLASLFVGAAILFAGCLGRSPDVRHFTLGSQSESGAVAHASDLAVLIGPIRLPGYLERTQIARRAGGGEVELDEFNRWLGGFEANLTSALAAGVRRRLGSVRVVAYPSAAPFPIDYSIRIHVDEWIADESNSLRVGLRWAISGTAEGSIPTLAAHEDEIKLRSSSVEALVEAHDEAIAAFAGRLSVALVEVSAGQ